jgi:hypothetical protein
MDIMGLIGLMAGFSLELAPGSMAIMGFTGTSTTVTILITATTGPCR